MRALKIRRRAVAMIELIFAIVVIGIALLAVPNLITASTNSSYVALQQESINEAATKLNSILSYHWDEADTDPKFLDPILIVTDSGSSDLNEDNTTNKGRRKGTPKESYRSFIRADGVELNASTTLGMDSNDAGAKDDMDDFNGESVSFVQVQATTKDYIDQNISISTNVKYINDTNPVTSFDSKGISYNPNFAATVTGTKNVKAIDVTLTSTSGVQELQKTIVLHAFGCNIGAAELVERKF